jgi:hypothetical protein
MDSATVHQLATAVKTRKHRRTRPATERAPRQTTTRQRLTIAAATWIGLVAIIATCLSLHDLAASIEEVAQVATWKAFSLAAAIDANFIGTEMFSLFASASIARETHKATLATKVLTLGMSGVANAYAMASHQTNPYLQAACIFAGFSIPGLIALATYTLGKAVRA